MHQSHQLIDLNDLFFKWIYFNVRCRFDEGVDHLFADGSIDDVAFEHGQHHDDHILLEVEQLFEQLHLTRVLRQFVLHVGKEEQESSDGIPQSENHDTGNPSAAILSRILSRILWGILSRWISCFNQTLYNFWPSYNQFLPNFWPIFE